LRSGCTIQHRRGLLAARPEKRLDIIGADRGSFIDAKSRDLRFHAEFPQLAGNDPVITLDWRFKVADFIYDGVMEY
jgi:hypothetical protein